MSKVPPAAPHPVAGESAGGSPTFESPQVRTTENGHKIELLGTPQAREEAGFSLDQGRAQVAATTTQFPPGSSAPSDLAAVNEKSIPAVAQDALEVKVGLESREEEGRNGIEKSEGAGRDTLERRLQFSRELRAKKQARVAAGEALEKRLQDGPLQPWGKVIEDWKKSLPQEEKQHLHLLTSEADALLTAIKLHCSSEHLTVHNGTAYLDPEQAKCALDRLLRERIELRDYIVLTFSHPATKTQSSDEDGALRNFLAEEGPAKRLADDFMVRHTTVKPPERRELEIHLTQRLEQIKTITTGWQAVLGLTSDSPLTTELFAASLELALRNVPNYPFPQDVTSGFFEVSLENLLKSDKQGNYSEISNCWKQRQEAVLKEVTRHVRDVATELSESGARNDRDRNAIDILNLLKGGYCARGVAHRIASVHGSKMSSPSREEVKGYVTGHLDGIKRISGPLRELLTGRAGSPLNDNVLLVALEYVSTQRVPGGQTHSSLMRFLDSGNEQIPKSIKQQWERRKGEILVEMTRAVMNRLGDLALEILYNEESSPHARVLRFLMKDEPAERLARGFMKDRIVSLDEPLPPTGRSRKYSHEEELLGGPLYRWVELMTNVVLNLQKVLNLQEDGDSIKDLHEAALTFGLKKSGNRMPQNFREQQLEKFLESGDNCIPESLQIRWQELKAEGLGTATLQVLEHLKQLLRLEDDLDSVEHLEAVAREFAMHLVGENFDFSEGSEQWKKKLVELLNQDAGGSYPVPTENAEIMDAVLEAWRATKAGELDDPKPTGLTRTTSMAFPDDE